MDLFELGENLVNEVQDIRQDLRSGKISLEAYQQQMGGISVIEKLANMMIKARLTEERIQKPLAARFRVLPNPEDEKIKCPGLDFKLIKRSECLDYSGEAKFEDCEGCESGLSTKKVLLPEIPNANHR